jgi:integrase/recombinase XerD
VLQRTTARAAVNATIYPHWLRHTHGSHAIEKVPPLHALGHANVATASGYLHARPGSSSVTRRSPYEGLSSAVLLHYLW